MPDESKSSYHVLLMIHCNHPTITKLACQCLYHKGAYNSVIYIAMGNYKIVKIIYIAHFMVWLALEVTVAAFHACMQVLLLIVQILIFFPLFALLKILFHFCPKSLALKSVQFHTTFVWEFKGATRCLYFSNWQGLPDIIVIP